jgi:NAD(P)-dependent dehydrogenase (short-subunit alcohol dehydrogenase family)
MKGKVALVTGGSSGIGEATALAFARAGASVVIASRGESAGERVVQRIRELGGEALWLRTHVSRAEEVSGLVAQAVARFGRIDYAFNNGGSGGRMASVADMEEADWNATIGDFLSGVWLCMKHEIREMLKSGGGVIVNNSSVDGLRGFPLPGGAAYSAAKHGVIGLTKSAALEYIAHGIRINAICPGWIGTPPVQAFIGADAVRQAEIVRQEPIGRLGKPDEVADAVMWLCSERASFVVGTALAVDGGYLA